MMFKSSDPQIYPKHKDLYNWVDVDQRVYVPFNMSYLQESFGYVSKSSNASLHRDFFRGKATWSRFVPGLDKVGDAAERHSRRCHCRSLQSQQPQSGSGPLRGSAGLRLRHRPALLPQPWQTAESLFQEVSGYTNFPATIHLSVRTEEEGIGGRIEKIFLFLFFGKIWPREKLWKDFILFFVFCEFLKIFSNDQEANL